MQHDDPLLRLVTDTPVSNVRNFCILAHVDHGKTTVSDHLLTTNGLLSPALAGQVRYLDSRPDEQERLITMKASSVALVHNLDAARVRATYSSSSSSGDSESESKSKSQTTTPAPGRYVCNLLDCPGHIDFSSEVAAAVRLCDGGVIVVDLVDGVTMVTRAMLRQCYLEGLPMVLLLNKLDAIILRMQLTPEEGFSRMCAAVAECNAFLASCVSAEDIATGSTNATVAADAAEAAAEAAAAAAAEDEDLEDDEDAEAEAEEAPSASSTTVNVKKEHRARALEAPADEVWFCPTKGNVVFGSGLHGFGFQLRDFAALYKKTKFAKIDTAELARGMWGEHYLDPKTMTITTQPKKAGAPPLGLVLFCEPLWNLHNAFHERELDEARVRDMLTKLSMEASPNFFKNTPQAVQAAQQRYGPDGVNLPKLFMLLGEWMPLSTVLLDAVCCRLPSPMDSQQRRAPLLVEAAVAVGAAETAATAAAAAAAAAASPDAVASSVSQLEQQQQVEAGNDRAAETSRAVAVLSACDRADSAPLYAFVAKLLDVQYLAGVLPSSSSSAMAPSASASSSSSNAASSPNDFVLDDHFVALTRVYSGRLAKGATVCVESANKQPRACTVTEVYVLRGQGLEPVPFVAAGNICAIRGCASSIVKFATVCDVLAVKHEVPLDDNEDNENDDDPFPEEAAAASVEKKPQRTRTVITIRNALPFLAPIRLLSSSVVQLAVTPAQPDDLATLLRGLKLLYQTDPQVELAVLPSGDHVIRCAGEVHAERCIEDLRTTFARVDLCVSDPIVGLRETLSGGTGTTANRITPAATVSVPLTATTALQLAALALPPDVREVLMSNASEDHGSAPESARTIISMLLSPQMMSQQDRRRGALWRRMFRTSASATATNQKEPARIVAWGPQKLNFCGNLLIDASGGLFHRLDAAVQEAIVSGFELGVSRGPMADEPMFGLAFVITDISGMSMEQPQRQQNIEQQQEQQQQQQQQQQLVGVTGVLTGHITSSVAQGCRAAFSAHASSQRIVEPVYECLVYSAGQTRGKIYRILHRRRAAIGDEILQEGSDMFSIRSLLPATESFGLQDELRTETSGAATAQLRMTRWEALDVDPFYKPTTREELEEQGATVDKPNLAATIIDTVRKRKGLYRQQVVKHAEKQKFSIRAG